MFRQWLFNKYNLQNDIFLLKKKTALIIEKKTYAAKLKLSLISREIRTNCRRVEFMSSFI